MPPKRIQTTHPTKPQNWPTEGDRPAPRATLTGAYPGQKAIRKKPVSLPPPGELTQHAEEDLRASELRAERRVGSKKKKAKEAAKGSGNESRGKKSRKEDAVKGKGVAKNRKGFGQVGLTMQLEMQSKRAGWGVSETGELKYIPFTDRFVSAKTLRFRQQRQNDNDGIMRKKGYPKGTEKQEIKETKTKSFPFLDLPDSVKTRVYRLVVGDSKSCIWPTSPTGAEQPDFSMVCKEIRSAVLPIFYGENTFAVDIAMPADDPLKERQKSGQAPMTRAISGLQAVHKWAKVLSEKRKDDGEWFGKIKNWCFTYQDPGAGFESSKAASNAVSANRSFVVSLRIADTMGEEGLINVEVHRHAACVMPGLAEYYDRCAIKWAPDELCKAVTRWLQQSEVDEAQGLKDLVLEMREMTALLSDPDKRCDSVRQSIEMEDRQKAIE